LRERGKNTTVRNRKAANSSGDLSQKGNEKGGKKKKNEHLVGGEKLLSFRGRKGLVISFQKRKHFKCERKRGSLAASF